MASLGSDGLELVLRRGLHSVDASLYSSPVSPLWV
jgi:hypothetical protein